MGSQNQSFTDRQALVFRRNPPLEPARTRELAVDFVNHQKRACQVLASLSYPLERYVMEITAGSLALFREGADVARQKSGAAIGKKVGYRYAGLTAGHVEEVTKRVGERDRARISESKFVDWQSEFLMRFTFTVIEAIVERTFPPPVVTPGSPRGMKQLRWHLADVLEDARSVRDQIIKGNLLLCARVAQDWHTEVITKDDLFSAGYEGLRIAIDRFDPSRGNFSTYAVPWIKQEVGRYIQENRNIYRVPIAKQAMVNKMRREGQNLEGLENLAPSAVSFDAPLGGEDDPGFTLKEVLADPSAPRPSDNADKSDLSAMLEGPLGELDSLAQLILALRSDMGNAAEIGEQLFARERSASRARGRVLVEDASRSADELARLKVTDSSPNRGA